MRSGLSQDPTFRVDRFREALWDRGAALTSRVADLRDGILTEEENFAGLARLNRELIGKAEALGSPYRTVLDMDSTEIPSTGAGTECLQRALSNPPVIHPLLLFKPRGRLVWPPSSVPGNVHSAEGLGRTSVCRRSSDSSIGERKWHFEQTQPLPSRRFTKALEERGVKYAIRIPATNNLETRYCPNWCRRPWEGPHRKTVGRVQGLSVPSRELENGAKSRCGKGRTSCGRVVSRASGSS